LAAKMALGEMDEALIWSDVVSFDGRPFRGRLDGIFGGYPCQPFSVAGERKGAEDSRSLWPSIVRIIKEVEPSFVFFENVKGHVSKGLEEVIEALFSIGLNTIEWDVFSAAETGATHIRERLFVLAYADGFELRIEPERLAGRRSETIQGKGETESFEHGFERNLAGFERLDKKGQIESGICRTNDGLADRMDRLRSLGNSVHPKTAARAFKELYIRSRESIDG